jgi:hypothetical protein
LKVSAGFGIILKGVQFIIFKVAFVNNIVSILLGHLAALRLSTGCARNDSGLGPIEGAFSLLVALGPTHLEVAAVEVMRLRVGTLFVVMSTATLG